MLEEIESKVGDLIRSVMLERRFDHPGAVHSVPYANFQKAARTTTLDRPAEMAVAIRHSIFDSIDRALKSAGRIQLTGVEQRANPSMLNDGQNGIQWCTQPR